VTPTKISFFELLYFYWLYSNQIFIILV